MYSTELLELLALDELDEDELPARDEDELPARDEDELYRSTTKTY